MSALIDVPGQFKEIESFDGTRLTYAVFGDGPHTFVLAPALAAPMISYKYLLERLAPHVRVITWDMRGSYRSQVPARGVEAMGMEAHVADLITIADREGIARFVTGGWSMAVQIGLETWHRHRERVDGLILINGGYGSILSHAFHLPMADRLIGRLLWLGQKFSPVVAPVVSTVVRQDAFIRALRAAGIVTNNLEHFSKVVREFATLDFGLYFGMMEKLNEHDAEPFLGQIDVPTVVTAGTKDLMTPVKSARFMANRIAGAELVVVDNGTHYTPIEYPEPICDAAEALLRRVYPDAFAAPAEQAYGACGE